MADCTTNSRSADGITVGLIDGLLTTCRVLRDRDLTAPTVREALADLAADPDLAALLRAAQAPAESWYDTHAALLQRLAARVGELWENQKSLEAQISDLVLQVQRLSRRIDHATGPSAG